MAIRYAKHPAAHYGLPFDDDVQMYNWRYLVKGTSAEPHFDAALRQHFNEYQREAMTLEPIEALDYVTKLLPEYANEDVVARMTEAQARLFPPLIAGRSENVVTINFHRYKK